MASVDILLATFNRLPSFIMTLSGIAGQSRSNFRLIISDQSDKPVQDDAVVQSLVRVIEARGGTVEFHHRQQSQGIAEQRDYLLQKATAQYVLFLDDDVWMEPHVLGMMTATLEEQQCGFIGASPTSLAARDDYRPDQQHIEFWEGPVQPEVVTPQTGQWQRSELHQGANLHHVSLQIPQGEHYLYKVAWTPACILYDRARLLETGGFSYWDRLPRNQRGAEILVQNRMMRQWGGCAIIPSGTFYADIPSTGSSETGGEIAALDLMESLVDELSEEMTAEPV